MEYAIYITFDETIERDYCYLSSNAYDSNTINLNIFTNGKERINFKKLNYIALNESIYSDFITFFSYGRNVFDNAKLIHLTNTSEEEKNTREENEKLARVISLNKELQNKKIYIDVGSISLSEGDLESLKPLKNCSFSMVTFDQSNIFHSINELEILSEMVNEIVKRTKKYDFTPIEQMLYAYDLIRTNFMVSKTYEEKMENILKLYNEPSYCYALIFKEVLDRLKIRNLYSFGNFYFDTTRAFNIAYVVDEEYDIEGIYYFDIGNNSKQRAVNSLIDGPSSIEDIINNYEFFCKNKSIMEDRGSLDEDYTFGDFDDSFMIIFDHFLEKHGINGVYKLRTLLNNVGYFIDGKNVIDPFKGISSEEELDRIRNAAERYASLFAKGIDGEDFLEILFNVRRVQYMENKELFPLSIETLRKCLYNSQFPFSQMFLDFQDEQEYEQEDIEEMIEETFDSSFEDSIASKNIEERIRKLKLTLEKDSEKPNNDNNN